MALGNDWKKSLLTLKDEPFFELVKNFLGPLQTPYHKPSIIDALEKFLIRPETRERLFLLLSRDELRIAGSILSMEGIDLESLYTLFREEYSSLRFRSLIENLQERLILYKDSDLRLWITPLLSDDIKRMTGPAPVDIFPVNITPSEPWLNEDILLAFLSLIKEIPSLHRQDGIVKKRNMDILQERLGARISQKEINLLLMLSIKLRLISDTDGSFEVNYGVLKHFMSSPPAVRIRYVIAGLAASAWQSETQETGYAGGKRVADFLLDSLKPSTAYSLNGLIDRLCTAGSRKELRLTVRQRIQDALALIEDGGFLIRESGTEEDSRFVISALGAVPVLSAEPSGHSGSESGRPLLQPTFEILLPPDAPGSAKAFAALYCKLLRYDRVSHYELDEYLFVSAVRNEGSQPGIEKSLREFCGGQVPQNISMTVSGWLNKLRQIEISTGTVIKVSPEIVQVMEDQFASMILETLAEGVYFIRPEKLSPFLLKWKSLGYTDPGEIRNLLSISSVSKEFNFALTVETPQLETKLQSKVGNIGDSLSGTESDRTPQMIQQELTEKLSTLDTSPDQLSELEAKIEKKIILFPDQLNTEICRIGRLEARGIDFHAKLRIIEDVLSGEQDLLEIDTPEVEDSPVLVCPISLEKNPGNPEMKALVLPEEKERTFKIRRAVRIRKRKRSLYY